MREIANYLNFRGSIESHCIDTLEQIWLQVELLKTFHRIQRTVRVLALDLQIILVLHQALSDHLEKIFLLCFANSSYKTFCRRDFSATDIVSTAGAPPLLTLSPSICFRA